VGVDEGKKRNKADHSAGLRPSSKRSGNFLETPTRKPSNAEALFAFNCVTVHAHSKTVSAHHILRPSSLLANQGWEMASLAEMTKVKAAFKRRR